jgi:hypothetical protein
MSQRPYCKDCQVELNPHGVCPACEVRYRVLADGNLEVAAPPVYRNQVLDYDKQPPATPIDWMLLLLGAGIAVCLSLVGWRIAIAGDNLGALVLSTVWNLLLWGPPIVVTTYRWRLGMLTGMHQASYLVRTFWMVQWMVLVPIGLIGLSILAFAVAVFSNCWF